MILYKPYNKTTLTNLMVKIPKGEIQMRDDRLQKTWMVTINPFLLSKHLVTQDLYENIMGTNPSMFKGSNKPVESISWKDAVEFCNQLSKAEGLDLCYLFSIENETITFNSKANGYRLPTEAEWEFACKANTTGIRYGQLDEIAWYKKNSNGSTQPIGTKAPNTWGLYDMLGNVWEWCSDIYDETVYGSYRIFRGGGWSDEPRSCMATNRRRSHPIAFKIDDLGFRIARNIDQ